MPGMNGLDLCCRIHREYKNSGIPYPKVIVYSGVDSESIKNAAIEDDSVHYWIIKKDFDKLHQIIQSILV
jgi:DNA-binding NarL/FixJ family response regulator